MSDTGDGRDILAGEYALGVLEGEALAEVERLMASDPDFAGEVAAWRNRLTPLAGLAPPVPPPAALWGRISASTGADNVVPLRRLRIWQSATMGSLALAACLAAFMVIRQPEPPRVAVLAPLAGGSPVLVATLEAGRLTIRPNGTIAVPSGRDLELWSLAQGETRPRSLGVLPEGGARLAARVAAGTRLLVSLEPAGGSPTGQPTGPVLYGGIVTVVD
jgi:anti-sigma-K factor RskA